MNAINKKRTVMENQYFFNSKLKWIKMDWKILCIFVPRKFDCNMLERMDPFNIEVFK